MPIAVGVLLVTGWWTGLALELQSWTGGFETAL
jgi:hypothetical protein